MPAHEIGDHELSVRPECRQLVASGGDGGERPLHERSVHGVAAAAGPRDDVQLL